jgi:catechol 2,3-dioxygenase-like lactoylglutathione lyase family enzyme
MATTEANTRAQVTPATVESCDLKLEVVTIPVADTDRTKAFFLELGWRLDADLSLGDDIRIVQFTPPGSSCSIQFGVGVSGATPGSARHLELVVSDIEAARAQLSRRGAKVSEPFHGVPFSQAGRIPGLDPTRGSYGSFAAFEDPDGNEFVLQEVTHRLPGRVDPSTTSFGSVADLADAMRKASVAHGEHEQRIGAADPDWPDWYATYMAAEQSGSGLPQ